MKNEKYTKFQISKAILKTFEEMNKATFEKTIKGKGDFTDVTQEDWDSLGVCGFEMVDIKEMILKNLNPTSK